MSKNTTTKRPSQKELIADFKEYLEENTGYRLDFRSHGYLENSYGLTPTFNYKFAEMVVENLYDWANQFVEDNIESFGDFGGFCYNLMMSCEQLRSRSLKSYISEICDTLHTRCMGSTHLVDI